MGKKKNIRLIRWESNEVKGDGITVGRHRRKPKAWKGEPSLRACRRNLDAKGGGHLSQQQKTNKNGQKHNKKKNQ